MCGIIGAAGSLEHKDQDLIKRLLAYDYWRGPDATGLAAVRTNGEIYIDKIASHPFDLFERTRFKGVVSNGHNTKVFLGHNRLATKGANTNTNAHPFQTDNITGVHNGTLFQSSQKALEKELGEIFEVDSQALIASIARNGLKATIEAVEGAWSIVYHDANDNTINFIRNKERPMHYAYSEDFKKLIWASDWWMIEMAAKHSQGYKLYADNNGDSFFTTEVDVHYRWDLDELRKGGSLPKPKIKKIEGKEAAPSTSGYCPFQRHENSHSGTQSSGTGHGSRSNSGATSSTTTSRTSSHNRERAFYHIVGRRSRPFGDFYREEEYLRISKSGCAWCGGKLNFQDRGQLIIENVDAIVCPKCSTDNRQNRILTKYDMQFA